MTTVYTIWAEWDLGINYNIYASLEKAIEDLDDALQDNVDMTYEHAVENNMAGIWEREVIQ